MSIEVISGTLPDLAHAAEYIAAITMCAAREEEEDGERSTQTDSESASSTSGTQSQYSEYTMEEINQDGDDTIWTDESLLEKSEDPTAGSVDSENVDEQPQQELGLANLDMDVKRKSFRCDVLAAKGFTPGMRTTSSHGHVYYNLQNNLRRIWLHYYLSFGRNHLKRTTGT